MLNIMANYTHFRIIEIDSFMNYLTTFTFAMLLDKVFYFMICI